MNIKLLVIILYCPLRATGTAGISYFVLALVIWVFSISLARGSSRWGLVTGKIWITSLELSAPCLRKGTGLKTEWLISQVYMMTLPWKPLKHEVWRATGLLNTSPWQEGDVSQLRGDRNSCAQNLMNLTWCIYSSGCSFVSFIIFYYAIY